MRSAGHRFRASPELSGAAKVRRQISPQSTRYAMHGYRPGTLRPRAHSRERWRSAKAADELAFGVGLGTVLHADDRHPVENSTSAPWSGVCALHIRLEDGIEVIGTGWLMTPQVAVTAGHCVYQHNHGGWAREIRVIPALDGTRRPFSSATSSRYCTTEGWISSARDRDYDYAAILLDVELSGAAVFGYAPSSDDHLRAAHANISGYPADLNPNRQYFHGRTITEVDTHWLYYEIDTFGGQSGSPIWITNGRRQVAVGIHTTGGETYNAGIRITDEVADNLERWRSGCK